LPPKGHSVMFGVIFCFHNEAVGVLLAFSHEIWARGAAKHPSLNCLAPIRKKLF
jgi:hypothetical protein